LIVGNVWLGTNFCGGGGGGGKVVTPFLAFLLLAVMGVSYVVVVYLLMYVCMYLQV
jgi:hypothetical protein